MESSINSVPVTRLSWALRSIAGSIDTRLSWALRSIAGTIDTRLFWALRPYIGSIVNALDWAPKTAFARNGRRPGIRFICPFHFRCNQRGGAKLSNGVTMGNFGWVFLRVNID